LNTFIKGGEKEEDGKLLCKQGVMWPYITLVEIKEGNKISNIKENFTEFSTRISFELVGKTITGLLMF